MFLSRNKKKYVYPCKPQFYYVKMGFNGVKIIKACFYDDIPFNKENAAQDRNQEGTKSISQVKSFKGHPASLTHS